jgi:hypothetical protein
MGPSLKTVRMQHPLGLLVSSPFGLCTYGYLAAASCPSAASLSSGIVRTRRTGGYGVRRVARYVAVTRKAARCRSGSEVERRTAAHHRFHRLAESMRSVLPSLGRRACGLSLSRRERRPRPPLNPTASRILLCSTLLCVFSTTLAHTTVRRVTRAVGC